MIDPALQGLRFVVYFWRNVSLKRQPLPPPVFALSSAVGFHNRKTPGRVGQIHGCSILTHHASALAPRPKEAFDDQTCDSWDPYAFRLSTNTGGNANLGVVFKMT
jgi:hypothetical protein